MKTFWPLINTDEHGSVLISVDPCSSVADKDVFRSGYAEDV
jgi:hypothetical protein